MKELVNAMNTSTKTAFKTLSDLFGKPPFLYQDNALKIIEKFNSELDCFYDEDIKKACLALYKWRKCTEFPSVNHVLSELIDAPKKHGLCENNEPAPPLELQAVWDEAMLFFTATRAFISVEVYDKAMEMFNRLKFPFLLEVKFKVFNTFDKFVFGKNETYNYKNEYLNYVLAFKNGAFDKLKDEFKTNLQSNDEIQRQIKERNLKEKQKNAQN